MGVHSAGDANARSLRRHRPDLPLPRDDVRADRAPRDRERFRVRPDGSADRPVRRFACGAWSRASRRGDRSARDGSPAGEDAATPGVAAVRRARRCRRHRGDRECVACAQLPGEPRDVDGFDAPQRREPDAGTRGAEGEAGGRRGVRHDVLERGLDRGPRGHGVRRRALRPLRRRPRSTPFWSRGSTVRGSVAVPRPAAPRRPAARAPARASRPPGGARAPAPRVARRRSRTRARSRGE